MTTNPELRKIADQSAGRHIPDGAYDWLINTYMHHLEGPDDAEALGEFYRGAIANLVEEPSSKRGTSKAKPRAIDWTTYGICAAERSMRVAKLANEADVLVDFRERHSLAKTLSPVKVLEWLTDRDMVVEQTILLFADNLSSAVGSLTVAVSDAKSPFHSDQFAFDPDRWREPYVQYMDRCPVYMVRTPKVSNEVFNDLRGASRHLALAYGWHPAEAAAFILTGVPPIMPMARISHGGGNNGVRSRIKIDVDQSFPPEALASEFRTARSAAGYKTRKGPTHMQALLAFFNRTTAYRSKPTARWKLWNRELPEMKFTSLANFLRASRNAEDLVDPSINK